MYNVILLEHITFTPIQTNISKSSFGTASMSENFPEAKAVLSDEIANLQYVEINRRFIGAAF